MPYLSLKSFVCIQAQSTWGIDVSGTAQGAGGVGGLLASTLHDGASSQTFLPSFDGNGNISAWSDPGGALLTRTDYSPFGQVVARYRLGPPGDTRPDRLAFGFSTKYTDAESGLLYYGYRYLDPVSGRWLSRDPIGERGGVNLYGFVGNSPMQKMDFLGKETIPQPYSREDLWDTLINNKTPAWPWKSGVKFIKYRGVDFIPSKIEDYCLCDEEGIQRGEDKLVATWAQWAVQYEKATGIPIGNEGKGDLDSCISTNTDFFDYLADKIPDCWECEIEEGWRDFRPEETSAWQNVKDAISGYRGRANHVWVTCTARFRDGGVKSIAFDYWRRTSDVFGGMSPRVNRFDYPFQEGIVEDSPLFD